MRFDIDTYREIADSLLRNKSRSILTGFGVFWGIFMLLFLLGGGNGVKSMLSKNFEGFANNTAVVVSANTSKAYHGFQEGRYWNMTIQDIDRLKMMIPELDVVTPMAAGYGDKAVYKENSYNSVNLKGVRPDYSKIEIPELKYGRFLNEMDEIQGRKVCVIGKRIYESLFPDGGDPCGEYIQVGALYYQIVGVNVSSGNLSVNGSASQSVLIPYSVAQLIFNKGNNVDIVMVTGKEGVKMSEVEGRIRSVMAHQHHFRVDDEPAMLYINTETIFNLIDNLFKGVNFLILLVGLGTILAGAIGVSNIMMVTVKERTTEIGIRRAIGATPKMILSQIMTESIVLTLFAGCLGIVFSVFVLMGAEAVTHHQATFQVSFWTAVAAASFLAVLGAIAGLAPASRAMAIKPVDAMRDE